MTKTTENTKAIKESLRQGAQIKLGLSKNSDLLVYYLNEALLMVKPCLLDLYNWAKSKYEELKK
jgi:hypothetical protein